MLNSVLVVLDFYSRVERKEKARLKSVKFQGKSSVNDGKVSENIFFNFLLPFICNLDTIYYR